MTNNPKPRFRIGRFLYISALGIVLVAGLALVIVPRFIPWEKIKTRAEEKISETIHHRVTIGSIHFNVFRGIEIKDLKIENARGFSQEPLLTDEIASLQYRLLPLLAGKVMIKAVKLKRPQLLIEKKADGRFNFSDMLPPPSVSAPKPESKIKTPTRLPVELLIARVEISDASLIYRDLAKKSEQRLEDFNLSIQNLTLAGLTPVKVNLEVKLQSMGQTIPLAVETSWRFNYLQEEFILEEFILDLPGVKVRAEGQVEKVLTEPSLDLSGKVKADFNRVLNKLLPLPVRKKMPREMKVGGTAEIDFKAKGPVKDGPGKLSFSSRLQIAGLEASYKDKALLQDLSAALIILPDKITLKTLTGRLAGQSFRASLQARGFDLRQPDTLKPGRLKATVKWKLESDLLDMDALLALMPKPPDPANTDQPPATRTVLARPEPDARKLIPANLKVDGEAKLGGLRLGAVKLGAMDFSMNLNKRRLKSSGTLRGYQGSIKDSLQLDFTGKVLRYTIKTQVRNVNLEPLLNDVVDTFIAAKLKKPELISELKSKMTGILSGQMDISGSGMHSAKAKPALKGQGSFTLKKGSLRQFAFQDKLAQWFGSDKLKQDIPFDHTVMEFSLGQQIVKVTKFTAESGPRGEAGDIRMTANGKLTFKAAFQDFKLRPRLHPRAAKELSPEFRKYNEILKDDRGWVTIPVVLNGPIKKPGVKPDWDWIRKQFAGKAKRKIKTAADEAGKKVGKFITKQKNKPPEEIKQDLNRELNKAKEKLKDFNLKNLFK